MIFPLRASAAVLFGAALLAGCAESNMLGGGPGDVSTGTLAPRVDQSCPPLAAKIDALRREGIAEKVEKAAAKKYKMTTADHAKADQLNKLNNEFQAKCSTLPPRTEAPGSAQTADAAAKTPAAKTKPAAKAAPVAIAPAPAAQTQ